MNDLFMYLLGQRRGGGGGGGAKFATGTYTAAETVGATNVSVEHGLGVEPTRMFWIVTAPAVSKISGKYVLFSVYADKNGSACAQGLSTGSTLNGYVFENYKIDNFTKTTNEITLG